MLLAENGVELSGRIQGFLFPSSLTNADNDATLTIKIHPRMVFGHITEEILWGVGVGEVVGIKGEAVSCMIKAGQADDSVEDVRTAEEEVGSMHCTHGATGCHEGFAIVITNIGQQFLNDVVEPTFMLLYTPTWIASKVRPGFPVNAIHTDDANLA